MGHCIFQIFCFFFFFCFNYRHNRNHYFLRYRHESHCRHRPTVIVVALRDPFCSRRRHEFRQRAVSIRLSRPVIISTKSFLLRSVCSVFDFENGVTVLSRPSWTTCSTVRWWFPRLVRNKVAAKIFSKIERTLPATQLQYPGALRNLSWFSKTTQTHPPLSLPVMYVRWFRPVSGLVELSARDLRSVGDIYSIDGPGRVCLEKNIKTLVVRFTRVPPSTTKVRSELRHRPPTTAHVRPAGVPYDARRLVYSFFLYPAIRPFRKSFNVSRAMTSSPDKVQQHRTYRRALQGVRPITFSSFTIFTICKHTRSHTSIVCCARCGLRLQHKL